MNIEDYLTTKDLMDRYGITRQAVDYWRKRGLKFHQFGPKLIVYKEQEVEQFLRLNGNDKAKGDQR
jgi:hypothetical protein